MLRAVVFDVDFTLARPGPGSRARGLPSARASLRLRTRPLAVRGGAGGGVRRGRASSRARPRRGDLGALHRADHHRDGRQRRHLPGGRRDGAALVPLRVTSSSTTTCVPALAAIARPRALDRIALELFARPGRFRRASRARSPTRCSRRMRTARRSRTSRSSWRCSRCSTSRPAQAAMVGDTLHDDIEGARAVGMQRGADRSRRPPPGVSTARFAICAGFRRRSGSNRLQACAATNIFEPEFDHSSEREGYRWRAARVGRAIGSSQMGATLYELPDGERTYPFHFHHAIEEWLVVVSGTPTLRDSGGRADAARRRRRLLPDRGRGRPSGARAGDGADHLRERTISRSRSIRTAERSAFLIPRKVFRVADAVDYWEGE